MKPRVQAPKGWAFRVIIADRQGNYVFDDINNPDAVLLMAEHLWDEYRKKFNISKALDKACDKLG